MGWKDLERRVAALETRDGRVEYCPVCRSSLVAGLCCVPSCGWPAYIDKPEDWDVEAERATVRIMARENRDGPDTAGPFYPDHPSPDAMRRAREALGGSFNMDSSNPTMKAIARAIDSAVEEEHRKGLDAERCTIVMMERDARRQVAEERHKKDFMWTHRQLTALQARHAKLREAARDVLEQNARKRKPLEDPYYFVHPCEWDALREALEQSASGEPK